MNFPKELTVICLIYIYIYIYTLPRKLVKILIFVNNNAMYALFTLPYTLNAYI